MGRNLRHVRGIAVSLHDRADTKRVYSFRQIFYEILPLPHINRVEFYRKPCPLLQSSILLFVSRTDRGLQVFSQTQQRLISAIAERNMTSATSAKPTIARLIALLILANLPPNPPTERLQPAEYQTSPLVAMSMAQHLELDTALCALHEEDRTAWAIEDVTTLLENLCLVGTRHLDMDRHLLLINPSDSGIAWCIA